MYCSHCGAWNPEENMFCGKCGQRLQPSSSANQRWRIGSGVMVALVSLLVLVIIAAIAAFLLRGGLARVWQSLVPQPARTAVIPTATTTQVPTEPTATLTPLPSPSPTATELAAPTPSPTSAPEPTPIGRTFKLVYRDCIRHALSLGSVKGQVFNKAGSVIPGAKVGITINGYEWQSDANPATTNPEGWYEWILEPGQKIQFVELIVDGRSVPFSPHGFEVKATGSCFQRVDFVEQ